MGHCGSGLYGGAAVGLSDRHAEDVGGDRGRLPLRRGQLRPDSVLGACPAGGGDGASGLHLAGGERLSRLCAGDVAPRGLRGHRLRAVPCLRHHL